MKTFLIKITVTATLILLSGLTLKAQDAPLSVICNAKGTPADLKINQVRSILKGEKLRWNDGTKVSIALMKTTTPIGLITCKKIYNMSGNDLNKLFLALVFQGKGEAPTFFSTVTELQTYISQTPGAIGVIDATASNSEKVIRVDGKKSI